MTDPTPTPAPATHPATHPAAPTDERLAKRLAQQLGCSRREAEHYIAGGWVRVDGQVVEEPQSRIPAQRIELDPQASLVALPEVTLLLNKPAGCDDGCSEGDTGQPSRHATASAWQLLRADHRWAQDSSATRPLQRHFDKLQACVPLESGASGLLVFTQDWRVARKLREDAAEIEHELMVDVQGEVSTEALQRLHRRSGSRGQSLPPVKASLSSTGEGSSKLRFAVKGAHLGLIDFLCAGAGLHIMAIKRIRIGRVSLTQLPPGQWRYLQDAERF